MNAPDRINPKFSRFKLCACSERVELRVGESAFEFFNLYKLSSQIYDSLDVFFGPKNVEGRDMFPVSTSLVSIKENLRQADVMVLMKVREEEILNIERTDAV